MRPTIDLDADGVRHGFLHLPHSRDDSAWGAVMIPIAVIANGAGPTALLTGGNHGDEYEGPIALLDLARTLKPETVRGRVIVVPFMNQPAFAAAKRTSPIDGGNLNRAFPGRPDGTITEKIADYFQRRLLPVADYVLDVHSGGRTLDFLPFAAVHRQDDPAQERRCVAAMRAFSAPYSVVMRELDDVGMYDTAAEALGKVFVSTELGGGGTARAGTVAIAKRGVRNFLIHAGILTSPGGGTIDAPPSVMLDMPSEDCFVIAEAGGLLEMTRDLGDEVRAGETIACVHDTGRTGGTPKGYAARIDGLLVARHHPGLIAPGDCLAVVAVRA